MSLLRSYSVSFKPENDDFEFVETPINKQPTMSETFATFNIHGAPAEFVAELSALAPARLRAIYLACMPISEDTFANGSDSDQEIWASALKFVAQCPVLKTTLSEMALLALARSVF